MATLSICIPTHDGRAEVLDRLLENIEGQLVPGVREHLEVCVSDNGSRDGTTAVLARRMESLSAPLTTHRFERNDGFTPNLLKVMEIASGDFCWLIGSDDLIAPGGIVEVLALLDAHPEIAGLTLNRYRINFFDPENKHYDPPDELPVRADTLQSYDTAHEIFANVGLLHDYISTQVVARELFRDVARRVSAAELEEAKHFAHLLLLGRMVQRRPRWIWHPEALVQHTTGTSALDQDLGHDYTGYQLAVMEGRDTVWSMLLGRRSATYKVVMVKAYLRTARPVAIVSLKLMGNHGRRGDLHLLVALTRYFFWHLPFWTRTMPILLTPHIVIKGLSRLRREIAARRGR